eukprot:TRINITY_DN36628_c0_g2_i1.p1 TRINITY_DN36628_c0_g2~~TRINITY_DN36628_c0_g2_i1.p1  ORF type:complete len:123 (+),score=7.53 TRINITY_DN36628_c0_g2_i1:103-471(+)
MDKFAPAGLLRHRVGDERSARTSAAPNVAEASLCWRSLAAKASREVVGELRPEHAWQSVLLASHLLPLLLGVLYILTVVLRRPEDWPEESCGLGHLNYVAAVVCVFFAGALMNCSAVSGGLT